MTSPLIVGFNCSLRKDAHTFVLVRTALEGAASAGARTELMDLRDLPLPLFDHGPETASHPNVALVKERVLAADGLIVGSPEYHGCMSGAAKNFFDYLYHELAGRLVGLVSATGGSQGVSAIANMRAACQYCHAWTLPHQAAARWSDFDESNHLQNDAVRHRLLRVGRDVAVYGPILHQRFLDDLPLGDTDGAGFAGWHTGKV